MVFSCAVLTERGEGRGGRGSRERERGRGRRREKERERRGREEGERDEVRKSSGQRIYSAEIFQCSR